MTTRTTATSRKRQFGIDRYVEDRAHAINVLRHRGRNGQLNLSAVTVAYTDHSQRVIVLANGVTTPDDVSVQVAWALEWPHSSNHGGVTVPGAGMSAADTLKHKLSRVLGIDVAVVSA